MSKLDPLIKTKLNRPFLRRNLVPRTRLSEQIARGLRGPLTLITAPAGFGKTTLVASFSDSWELPVAWLALDNDDNQVERFLHYLVAALQEAKGLVVDRTAQLLAGVEQCPPETVLTTLVNELDNAGEEIALVLDDYQFVKNPTVHRAVTFLLEHCPQTFHLLIATRSDPPLPLARWRARGQMVELRAADLRFTEAETAQFLNDVMALRLSPDAIAALETRTEGWIAGLQMAALALQGSLPREGALAREGTLGLRSRKRIEEFIEAFSGTNRYILDYLLEEVLASQPPEIQHFLLQTSILERLTEPLCAYLLADDETPEREEPLYSKALSSNHSAPTLAYLERANLFIVPLDSERAWYRYHHLFVDLLRARLQEREPDSVSRLHRRAAAWLEKNRFMTEAIHHLCLARDHERAADLIERYAPTHLTNSDPSVLQMADQLPQSLILDRPKIALYQTWRLITQGRLAQAAPLLHDLARHLAGTTPDTDRRWMQAFVAAALAFLAPPASAERAAPLPEYRQLEAIPADEPILRNAADLLFGMSLGRRGDLEGAVAISLKSIQRQKNSQRIRSIPTLAPFLSRLYLMQGRLRAAASLCRQFLDPIKEKEIRFVHTAGSMKIDLGEVLYEWNNLEAAEAYIRDGLQDNEPWQNVMTAGFGLAALARLLQAKGDYASALAIVDAFERELQAHSHPREFDEDLGTLRVCIQLASGDLETSSRWADRMMLDGDSDSSGPRYRLALARIQLAQGQYTEAEALLKGTTPQADGGSRLAKKLKGDLLLAAAIAGQQRLPEAFALVESTLALAEPDGYVRTFLDIGEPARDLLAIYLHSDHPAHEQYAQKLMGNFALTNETTAANPPAVALIDPLTERELEVLQLVALGKSNKEIARQLVVATGTVKAHTASIYRKLDVGNRTKAAARARQLGILS